MRLVFFGTPEFAVPTLRALHGQGHTIMVVTRPDRPAGRGHRSTSPPIKRVAEELGLPCRQPRSLRHDSAEGKALMEEIKQWQARCGIVVAYGRIIPAELLSLPATGTLNVHPSLLPAYRGAAPVVAAIMHGERETGVTIMQLDEGLDTGPIFAQERMKISDQENAQALTKRLFERGTTLLLDILLSITDGTRSPIPQKEKSASVCRLFHTRDRQLYWDLPGIFLSRKVRAFGPHPGAWTMCGKQRIAVCDGTLDEHGNFFPTRVQPEGKKPMSIDDFRRGNPQCPSALSSYDGSRGSAQTSDEFAHRSQE